MNASDLLKGYNLAHLTIGSLGGHTALDVCSGAKRSGFQTVVVTQKGREKTYEKYFRARKDIGCVDNVLKLAKFQDVLKKENQAKLRKLNTIFIHSRYFWVYFENFKEVEEKFQLPIFGSRTLIKLEERDQPFNQYHVLHKAGIRIPRLYKGPEAMGSELCIVKAKEARRGYERAFFLCNRETYDGEARKRVALGQITPKGLKEATIEEFIVGAPINFNFFYSPITGRLELLGTDTRRQTNLDGFLRLLAEDQSTAMRFVPLKMVETGHIAVTVKESILEKAFDLGEKFVKATKTLPRSLDPSGKGIIGPFALQGAVVAEEGKEDIVIFDVSFRIPGSPGSAATPYSGYLYGQPVGVGERIGMEIRTAVEQGCLEKIIT